MDLKGLNFFIIKLSIFILCYLKSSVPAWRAASKKATPSRQFPALHNFSPSNANCRQVSLSPDEAVESPLVVVVVVVAASIVAATDESSGDGLTFVAVRKELTMPIYSILRFENLQRRSLLLLSLLLLSCDVLSNLPRKVKKVD
jgi:hypothetical protein